ncbi:MAG: hypothetical protein HQK49_15990 [Oligoflexia bacterium]|nr:hypothetical protein [Oligoflexia bacterium]
MARKPEKRIYYYECSITGEKFKTTREAPNPKELISVDAFYDLNPDKDDRSPLIKDQRKEVQKKRELLQQMQIQMQTESGKKLGSQGSGDGI